MSFQRKWMKLKISVLSKIKQTQNNNKYHIFLSYVESILCVCVNDHAHTYLNPITCVCLCLCVCVCMCVCVRVCILKETQDEGRKNEKETQTNITCFLSKVDQYILCMCDIKADRRLFGGIKENMYVQGQRVSQVISIDIIVQITYMN